jgi:hypothetical protein
MHPRTAVAAGRSAFRSTVVPQRHAFDRAIERSFRLPGHRAIGFARTTIAADVEQPRVDDERIGVVMRSSARLKHHDVGAIA